MFVSASRVLHFNGRNTFGVGIVREDGKILANERSTYIPEIGWGIEPTKAANHHEYIKEILFKNTLKKSKLKMQDIDIIAYSRGAGLPPCLHVGFNFSKELAEKYKKPLIPVCHQVAHIEIGKLTTKCIDPVVLYVSGGNTQIISLVGKRYAIFGETQDIGIGNALDKFGRELGMEFPSGPKIEELAKKGKWIELPYVVKGMDLSFSGIVTEALKKSKTEKLEDICFSLQETCFSMLTEVVERALAHNGKEEVLLTGGVAANKRLQEMLNIMCKERGAKFYSCPREYSGDNASMISWNGILAWKFRRSDKFETNIFSRWRTDEVDVTWL